MRQIVQPPRSQGRPSVHSGSGPAVGHVRQHKTQLCLSRGDQMIVARHEMPGMCHPEARPVGNGMIGWREVLVPRWWTKLAAPAHRPFPTGRIMSGLYQAFHAWLPSFRPVGTEVSFLRLTRMSSRRIH